MCVYTQHERTTVIIVVRVANVIERAVQLLCVLNVCSTVDRMQDNVGTHEITMLQMSMHAEHHIYIDSNYMYINIRIFWSICIS